jgi:disulfide bond formation protein DsbB
MRLPYLAALGCIIGLTAFAFYLQYVKFLDPCPLCMAQRLVFYAMAGLFLLGALHNPRQWGGRVYGILLGIFSAAGVWLAGRHLWLQSLPADQVPACGPGLEYMIQTMPFSKVLASMIMGDGNCAEVAWSFLGLSMPAWTLGWYLALGLVGLYFGWRGSRHQHRSAA